MKMRTRTAAGVVERGSLLVGRTSELACGKCIRRSVIPRRLCEFIAWLLPSGTDPASVPALLLRFKLPSSRCDAAGQGQDWPVPALALRLSAHPFVWKPASTVIMKRNALHSKYPSHNSRRHSQDTLSSRRHRTGSEPVQRMPAASVSDEWSDVAHATDLLARQTLVNRSERVKLVVEGVLVTRVEEDLDDLLDRRARHQHSLVAPRFRLVLTFEPSTFWRVRLPEISAG